jgi:hypothetical protein
MGKAFSLEQGWDAHHRSHPLWAGDSGSPEIERPKMGQIAPTLGLARKTSAEAKNDSEWRIAIGDGFFLESIAPAPTKNFFGS